jgi:hypothetical protein
MRDWQLLLLTQQGEKERKKKDRQAKLFDSGCNMVFTRININIGTYEDRTFEHICELLE